MPFENIIFVTAANFLARCAVLPSVENAQGVVEWMSRPARRGASGSSEAAPDGGRLKSDSLFIFLSRLRRKGAFRIAAGRR
jgi:hypothetical protein